MREGSGFMSGLLLGVLLGGVFAVLYAPDRGEKTRKRWSKRGGQWLDEAGDQAGELVEKGRKKIGI